MERGRSKKIAMMGTKSMETAAAVNARKRVGMLALTNLERKQFAIRLPHEDLI